MVHSTEKMMTTNEQMVQIAELLFSLYSVVGLIKITKLERKSKDTYLQCVPSNFHLYQIKAFQVTIIYIYNCTTYHVITLCRIT